MKLFLTLLLLLVTETHLFSSTPLGVGNAGDLPGLGRNEPEVYTSLQLLPACTQAAQSQLLSSTKRLLHFSAGHPGRPISVIPVWAGQLTKQLDF